MISDLSALSIASDSSIRQAMACIDHNNAKIALVVDEERRLLDTITDGDVRRAILAGLDLDAPVSVLRGLKVASALSAASGSSRWHGPRCLVVPHARAQGTSGTTAGRGATDK